MHDCDRDRGSREPPALGKLRVEFDQHRNPPVRITNPSTDGGNIVHHDDGYFAFQSSAEASTEALSIIVRAARGKVVHGLVWFEDPPSSSNIRPDGPLGHSSMTPPPSSLDPIVKSEPRSVVPCKRRERSSSSIDSPGCSQYGMSSKARGKELLRQARPHLDAHPPIQGAVIGSIHSTDTDESEFKLVEGPDGEYTVEFKAHQLRPATGTPQYRCCNCDEKGHAAIDCVMPQADGYVWGCVWCNSRTHDCDDCDAPDKPKAPEAMFYMLVVRRARKPPIVTTVSWYDLLMDSYKGFKLQVRNLGEHVSAKECLLDMALRAGFPLTHARSMWMRINDPDPLINYDYHKMDTCSLLARRSRHQGH
ncbi:hypothetical protein BDP81DRAFT_472820 [Colletotrichum phormii]|uniref:CCHC-type domain-containing protein n=1 Tax=Colletotrichum phormii TaxID=359342 RepID=A0AAI9ZRF2_9PEZI|nr:uncharacterized protein BDP81DRAFT_472820 [Colletotrichum phormii]KAK1635312.1 hypothetical protein BDP81DRAFT_472820 [Colletotrichum phormii]